jgi:hypothetical protein
MMVRRVPALAIPEPAVSEPGDGACSLTSVVAVVRADA